MGKRKALVAGATGLVGGHLLDQLTEDTWYSEILVLTRRPLERKHEKIRELLIDFDNMEEALEGIPANDVYCCLGTTMKKAGSREAFRRVDHDYPLALAEVMHRNGAEKYLLVSALGADPKSMIFYNRVKGEVEKAVMQIGYAACYIFRPSLLLGERQETRSAEDMAKKTYKYLDKLFIGPFRKYKAIHGAEVASGMIRMAKSGPQGSVVVESHRIREV